MKKLLEDSNISLPEIECLMAAVENMSLPVPPVVTNDILDANGSDHVEVVRVFSKVGPREELICVVRHLEYNNLETWAIVVSDILNHVLDGVIKDTDFHPGLAEGLKRRWLKMIKSELTDPMFQEASGREEVPIPKDV